MEDIDQQLYYEIWKEYNLEGELEFLTILNGMSGPAITITIWIKTKSSTRLEWEVLTMESARTLSFGQQLNRSFVQFVSKELHRT